MRSGRLLVAVPVATALVFGCSGDSKDAGSPSRPSRADVPTTVDHPAYGAIEDALRGPGGLVVCGRGAEAGDASGSYERRTFALAVGGCPPEEGTPASDAVVVNAYDSTLIRDGSAEIDFGDRLAAWTYLQFVVSVTESSPPEVVGGVEAAMASLGAQKTYDERPSRNGGG
jgi:hypothetical protein